MALDLWAGPLSFLQAYGGGPLTFGNNPQPWGSDPLPSGDGCVIPSDSRVTCVVDLVDAAGYPGLFGKGLALFDGAPSGYDEVPSECGGGLEVFDTCENSVTSLTENARSLQPVLPVLP